MSTLGVILHCQFFSRWQFQVVVRFKQQTTTSRERGKSQPRGYELRSSINCAAFTVIKDENSRFYVEFYVQLSTNSPVTPTRRDNGESLFGCRNASRSAAVDPGVGPGQCPGGAARRRRPGRRDSEKPEGLGFVKTVLFVCTGNTCRSPLAEALTRVEAERRDIAVNVSSGGIYASDGAPA